MLKVFKYTVPVDDYPYFEVPFGAKVLHVGTQGLAICIWMLVDSEEIAKKILRLRIAGTGHEITDLPSRLNFLGMVMFSVFELRSEVAADAQA